MGKKSNKNNGRFVTVGERAYSFYDAATGINIVRGEKKELSTRQLNSLKIKRALATGHLVYASGDNKPVEQYNDETIEKMKVRLEDMINQGMTSDKIAQAFNLDQISKVASEYGLTVDEGDTVKDVIEAIAVEMTSDQTKE